MTNKRIALLSGFLILFFAFAFFAGMFVRGLIKDYSAEQKESGYRVAGELPETVSDAERLAWNLRGPSLTVDEQGNVVYAQAQTDESLSISWISPENQPKIPVDPALFKAACPDYDVDPTQDSGMGPTPSGNPCGIPQRVETRRLGSVTSGTYQGWYLDEMTFGREEMAISYRTVYYLSDPEGKQNNIVIDQASVSSSYTPFSIKSRISAMEILQWSSTGSLNDPQSIFDTGLRLPDLDPSMRLEGVNNESYRFVGYWVRFDAEDAKELTRSTSTVVLKDGRILLSYKPTEVPAEKVTGDDLYFMIDEDGRLLGYDIEIPFFSYGVNEYDGSTNFVSGIPQIVWSDSTLNTKTYLKGKLGGCGYLDTTHVIPEATARELNLVKVGTSNDPRKTPVFEPAFYDIEYFKDAFNVVTWENTPIEGEDPKAVLRSYKEFVHPYLYVRDANGRWVEMVSNEIVPPVECGKPVIYLYPTKPTDVTVFLAPEGGFSYTEPVYNKGWRVTAHPDGTLVNKDDGKTYPYLFWEGRGGLYSAPEKTWVIEKSQVESFLNKTLTQMNLNAQETKDFIEFWLPRMQDKPYYRIGFHGTQLMDTLAPMHLSVKPDHTFRILMDYTPLETIEPSNPPTLLPKANRSGFTVIEWGGVLR